MYVAQLLFVLDVPITTSSPCRSSLQNFRIVSWNFLFSCIFLVDISNVSMPRIFSRNEKHVFLSSFESSQSMLQESPYCYLCTADLKNYVEDLWGTGFYLFVWIYVSHLTQVLCVCYWHNEVLLHNYGLKKYFLPVDFLVICFSVLCKILEDWNKECYFFVYFCIVSNYVGNLGWVLSYMDVSLCDSWLGLRHPSNLMSVCSKQQPS